MKKTIILFMLVAVIGVDWSTAQPANTPPRPAKAAELVPLNFPNGTLDQIIQLYSELTNRTAIYASNLQGRIVLVSNGGLTAEDAVRALENALSVNGFSIIPQGEKFFKVVPSQVAKQEGVPFHATGGETSDRLMTRIVTLRYSDLQGVMQSIQPLIHPFGQLVPFPRTNSLLITDTAANIRQFEKMISHLDQPIEARVQAKFYQLKHAKAKEVLTQVQNLLQSSGVSSSATLAGGSGRPPGAVPPNTPPPQPAGADELMLSEDAIVIGKVSMSADDRTNQLVILTRTINLPFFDQLIGKLDIDTASTVVIKNIPLKYAKADETASLLGQMTGGPSGSTSGASSRIGGSTETGTTYQGAGQAPPAPPAPGGGFAGPSGSGDGLVSNAGVFADVRTNSILLVGTPDEVRPLESLIQEIDVLLAQVLIEGIIMEVTLTDDRAFGVAVLRAATDQAGINNTLDITPIDLATTAIPAAVTGPGLTYFATLSNRHIKLDIVAEALARDNDVTILSRPLLQTSHNEEARLFVGETRPYVTGTVSDVVGTATTAVRSQYESTEIGLELTVKPLINPDGLVVMDIIQKVENVNGFQTIDGNQIPIVAKREASSVVSIKDGQIVVLGGLTGNDRTYTKRGIPILRDIPILGYLFSGTDITKRKTELMVLLQPTVLRTPEDAYQEAVKRRNESKKLIKLKEQVEDENKEVE